VKVGDYVKMNVGDSLRGFVVERPYGDAQPNKFTRLWEKKQVWVLITSTPDGAFVGEIHPFQSKQVEVLSECR
jgi:hypothetical protein